MLVESKCPTDAQIDQSINGLFEKSEHGLTHAESLPDQIFVTFSNEVFLAC